MVDTLLRPRPFLYGSRGLGCSTWHPEAAPGTRRINRKRRPFRLGPRAAEPDELGFDGPLDPPSMIIGTRGSLFFGRLPIRPALDSSGEGTTQNRTREAFVDNSE